MMITTTRGVHDVICLEQVMRMTVLLLVQHVGKCQLWKLFDYSLEK